MRELKFRAWDEQRNQFYTTPKWVEFNVSYKGELTAINYDFEYRQQLLIVEQYTGLKDVNGVEIYEGDIVTVDGDHCKVRFDGGAFCVDVCGHDYDYTAIGWAMNNGHCIEVIGNIHQNHNLLVE